MIKIRNSVFETNSSSTHSIVVMKKEEWEKVKRGELFVNLAAHWYEGKNAPKHFTRYPELVTEDVLFTEGKKEHEEWHPNRNISWEEMMKGYDGKKQGYDTNLFGFAGETYINPNSSVWHKETVKELPDGKVEIEIDHFFG